MANKYAQIKDEELIRVYVPDVYTESLLGIDYNQLKDRGIKLISFDMDDTLAGGLDLTLSRKIITKFELLKSEGFELMIISNNGSKKVEKFADDLEIEFIKNAEKPKGKCFVEAINKYNRKHNESITVKNMAHVGDSMLNDVAGAKVSGVVSCLVRKESNIGGFWGAVFDKSEHELREVLKERGIWRKHHKSGKGHDTQYYQLNEGYKRQVW